MPLRYSKQLVWGLLSPENRFRLAFEISDFDREIRKQKLRREHPEWCELEVMNEIIRYAFRIKSEPIPEHLENFLQQRVREWRANQSAETGKQ